MFKKIRTFTKKSVVNTWLVSYLVVLIIPIIMNIISYVGAQGIVEQKIVEYNELLMGYVMKEVDRTVSENVRISDFFSTNSLVDKAQKITLPITTEDQYTFYQIQKDITSFQGSFFTEGSFYIYLKNSDMIISKSDVLPAKDFFTYFCANSMPISYVEWKSRLIEHDSPYIWAVEYSGNSNDKSVDNVLLRINQLPINSDVKTGAIVVQNFDSDIRKILSEGEKNAQSQYAVFDNNNHLLLSSPEISSLDYKSIEHIDEKEEFHFNGEKYLIRTVVSKGTGMKYITLISSNKLWSIMGKIRLISFGLMFFSIIIGIFIVVYLVRKNYSPIKTMLDVIRNQDTATDFDVNEYAVIDKVMQKLKQRNSDIQIRLEAQNEQLKERFLGRLLKGQVADDATMEEFFDAHDISFPNNNFTVLGFYIDDFSELFMDDQKTDFPSQIKMVHYVIKNVTEELASLNGNKGYLSVVDDIPMLLMCVSERNDKSLSDEATALAKKTQEFLKENLKIKLTISVSNTHSTNTGIAIAYKEAITAMEYRLILGEETIINYKNINTNTSKDEYSYTYEQEQLLINYIKTRNFELASKLVDEIFYECFECAIPQLNMARCLAFNMVGTLMKIRNELGGGSVAGDFFNAQDVIDRLLSWQTVDDLKKAMLQVINEFCLYCEKKQDIKIQSLVTDFVNEHYDDINLSLALIAERLKLNHCYLSTIFKEQSGEGLLEYINRYRIQKSKEILVSTSDSLESISSAVGYSSVKTFIRNYKKYEGVTPGKYREM